MISLKDSLVVFTEGAKVNYKLYGYLTPVFAGMLDGEPQTFALVWENPQDKDAFAKKVCEWIASNRLTEYILVSEAWSVNVNEENNKKDIQKWLLEHGSLENWKNRSEVAMVIYCSPNEEIDYTANIICGKITAPNIDGEEVTVKTLVDWNVNYRKLTFNVMDFNTRFQGLFFKGKAGQN